MLKLVVFIAGCVLADVAVVDITSRVNQNEANNDGSVDAKRIGNSDENTIGNILLAPNKDRVRNRPQHLQTVRKNLENLVYNAHYTALPIFSYNSGSFISI